MKIAFMVELQKGNLLFLTVLCLHLQLKYMNEKREKAENFRKKIGEFWA